MQPTGQTLIDCMVMNYAHLNPKLTKMKTIYINFLHHFSGNYGVFTDKLFGYSPKHWTWYNGVLEKYLFDPKAPHNKVKSKTKLTVILAQVCLWIYPIVLLVWSVYVRYFHR